MISMFSLRRGSSWLSQKALECQSNQRWPLVGWITSDRSQTLRAPLDLLNKNNTDLTKLRKKYLKTPYKLLSLTLV